MNEAMDLQAFLAMGGHGFYVWSSFGAVAVVMLVNWLLPVWQHRKLLRDLHRQAARQPGGHSA